MSRTEVDVDRFLAQPLVARVATAGPVVVPVWFLWEDGALWWLTGSWSRMRDRLAQDPAVAVVVDTCDLYTGEVVQLRARGLAEVVAYDRGRAYRKLSRYLGPDPATWDPRFALADLGSAESRFVRLHPDRLVAVDLSFQPPTPG